MVTAQELAGRDLDRRLAALEPGASIVVVTSGDPPPLIERASLPRRLVRVARLATTAMGVRLVAARLRRRFRAAGLTARRLDIGEPNDGYSLGIGDNRVWLPVEVAVAGGRGAERPTLLERAVDRAGYELGQRLEVERARVVASGALMAELATVGARARWILRLGGADGATSTSAADNIVEGLRASNPPQEVLSRLVIPAAQGTLDGLLWKIEERRGGTHPRHIDDDLWDECAAFLAALAETTSSAASPRSLTEEAAMLEPFAGERRLSTLRRIALRAEAELQGVRRCWGHGDFHAGNLLVHGSRLTAVLDWDAASPSALPGLDLIHLAATTDPELRRLPHGARCTRLQSILAGGGGMRLRSGIEAAGLPMRRGTLEALVHAYWLTRAARDLRAFPDRSERRDWLDLNVREPIDELGASRPPVSISP